MKSKLFTALVLLASMTLFSQESLISVVYLDSVDQVATKEHYKYKRVTQYYKNYSDIFLVSDYLQSGTIAMKAISLNKNHLELNGPRIDFYENGKWKRESIYVNNKLKGKQIEWYEDGEKKSEIMLEWDYKKNDYNVEILQFWDKECQQTLVDGTGFGEFTTEEISEKGEVKNGKKQGVWTGINNKENYTYAETFIDGKFISGISEDSKHNKYSYIELIEKPIYKKGDNDFYTYVGKNYNIPAEQGLKGKVFTTFEVDKDGSLINIKVLRDIGYGTGKEAIRVLSNSEKWTPGRNRGIPVKSRYNLPISINMSNDTGGFSNNSNGIESQMISNTNPNWAK
jgi:antitoxin component YwqK of YwqJK toxin-antitoxin module